MAYDLEEQEQIETLKTLWNKYGNLSTWLLIIVLAGFVGWNSWNRWQQSEVDKAGQLFDELQKSVDAKDNVKIQRAALDMEEKFSGTAYAQLSALAAAKSAFDSDDMKTAKQQLQWVMSNGLSDEYKAVAKIRLVGILLDEKSYDEGLKILAGEFPPEFASIVADRRGDIFVAQNKLSEARAAYQMALDKTDTKGSDRQLIQVKLDAIGGAPAKTAT